MAKCPCCEKEVQLNSAKKEETLDKINKDVDGLLKKEVMYSCPHCDRILGFAFFLGGFATGRP